MSSFLQKYSRQPKLYIDLPSKGEYYDDTVIQDNQMTKIPVFGMNAMDEIVFKTPDALLSGEATAQVLQSCIPYIRDPWKIVGFDIDYLLLSMRIATYGDVLPVTTNCPNCQHSQDSDISLQKLLENFVDYPTKFNFNLGDLVVNLKPLTYKETTEFSIEHMTLQRTLLAVNNNKDLDEKDRENQIKKLFAESETLNLRLAVSHIESITNGEETETDNSAILEFIQNNDQEFYKKLRTGIKDLTERWNLPNIEINCASEECKTNYKTNIDLDYSSFFGAPSLSSRNLI
jgi:hypothetical protein